MEQAKRTTRQILKSIRLEVRKQGGLPKKAYIWIQSSKNQKQDELLPKVLGTIIHNPYNPIFWFRENQSNHRWLVHNQEKYNKAIEHLQNMLFSKEANHVPIIEMSSAYLEVLSVEFLQHILLHKQQNQQQNQREQEGKKNKKPNKVTKQIIYYPFANIPEEEIQQLCEAFGVSQQKMKNNKDKQEHIQEDIQHHIQDLLNKSPKRASIRSVKVLKDIIDN